MAPNLTASEQHELREATRFLNDNPSATRLGNFFNTLSPNVRAVVRRNIDIVEDHRQSGGRQRPFEPKQELSLTPAQKQLIATHDTEDLTHRLNTRMGTSEQQSRIAEKPVDLRETLSASFDVVESEGGSHD